MKRALISACVLFTVVLASAASDGATDAAGGVAGAACSQTAPCASGFYCEPTSETCGPGTCTADPGACPLYQALGVCGCNGGAYYNLLCAELNGTTSAGPLAIAGATLADVEATWTRIVSYDSTTFPYPQVTETLQVTSSATYTLSQTSKCVPPRGSGVDCNEEIRTLGVTSGTVNVGSDGTFLFSAVTCESGNCANLATAFTLEHNCQAYTGPLQIAVVEPPGASEATNTYYLQQK